VYSPEADQRMPRLSPTEIFRHRLPGPRGARRRIGLFGGSFNPVHDGHLHASRLALRRLRLDEVWWLVSPQNPLKLQAGMAPFARRLADARAAAGDRRIRVTDIEQTLGTRYSVDTVAALRRLYPRTRFVWLAGADILQQLPRWRHWDRLFGRVAIAVFARAPYSFKALAGAAAHRFARSRIAERDAGSLAGRKPPVWVFLHAREHPASATAIRKRRDVKGSDIRNR
jgi:nicotinate-nucleotide adenylyltransferase